MSHKYEGPSSQGQNLLKTQGFGPVQPNVEPRIFYIRTCATINIEVLGTALRFLVEISWSDYENLSAAHARALKEGLVVCGDPWVEEVSGCWVLGSRVSR